MYFGRTPEALERWRKHPYADRVLVGIRERENRFEALEIEFAEAVSKGNNKRALAVTDDLESVLREWIAV